MSNKNPVEILEKVFDALFQSEIVEEIRTLSGEWRSNASCAGKWIEFDARIRDIFGISAPDMEEYENLKEALEKLVQETGNLTRQNQILSTEKENFELEIENLKKQLQDAADELRSIKNMVPEEVNEMDRLRLARKLNGHLLHLVGKMQDLISGAAQKENLDNYDYEKQKNKRRGRKPKN